MQSYLECVKKKKGMNDPECRDIAKAYLTCRMDRCAKTPFFFSAPLLISVPTIEISWRKTSLRIWALQTRRQPGK